MTAATLAASVVAALAALATLAAQVYWRRPYLHGTFGGPGVADVLYVQVRERRIVLVLDVRNDSDHVARDVAATLLLDGEPVRPAEQGPRPIPPHQHTRFAFRLARPEEAEMEGKRPTFRGKAVAARITCGRHSWTVGFGESGRLRGGLRSWLRRSR